jgi:hypothetical protein
MARLKSKVLSPEQTAVASSACFVKNAFWFGSNFWSASCNRALLVQAKTWTLRISPEMLLVVSFASLPSIPVIKWLCSRVIKKRLTPIHERAAPLALHCIFTENTFFFFAFNPFKSLIANVSICWSSSCGWNDHHQRLQSVINTYIYIYICYPYNSPRLIIRPAS